MPSTDHIVQPGECIASIAFQHGFFPDTLWDHPENGELKSLRKDPNVLLGGDRVAIPELQERTETCAVEKLHRFRRKGVPARLNTRLLRNGQPRANIRYALEVDGVPIEGTTDGDGWVRQGINPSARRAVLTLFPEGADPESYEISLGGLDPADTITGQKSRLKNLGFFAGEVDGSPCDELTSALSAFQTSQGLDPTGQADAPTIDALKKTHTS